MATQGVGMAILHTTLAALLRKTGRLQWTPRRKASAHLDKNGTYSDAFVAPFTVIEARG